MILTADIGNLTTTLALFENRENKKRIALRSSFATTPHATADQYAIQLVSILQLYGVEVSSVTGGIVASVVPSVTAALAGAIERLTGRPPLIVGAGLRTGLNIKADMHNQLGADIVATCVAAAEQYPSPVIVVDFGTAVTFSVLRGNVYEGCAIAPGVRVSLEALSGRAAALPNISLGRPADILGHNTVDAMRAGAVYGSASMVDGMLERLEESIQPAAAVVATGAGMDDIVPYCRRRILKDPDLLLHGLYLLYQKNAKKYGNSIASKQSSEKLSL